MKHKGKLREARMLTYMILKTRYVQQTTDANLYYDPGLRSKPHWTLEWVLTYVVALGCYPVQAE